MRLPPTLHSIASNKPTLCNTCKQQPPKAIAPSGLMLCTGCDRYICPRCWSLGRPVCIRCDLGKEARP